MNVWTGSEKAGNSLLVDSYLIHFWKISVEAVGGLPSAQWPTHVQARPKVSSFDDPEQKSEPEVML